MTTESISAFFFAMPGDPLDQAAHHVFRDHGGEFIGAGTSFMGASSGERDVQYRVPAERADACKATLTKAGFRLEPTPA